MSALHHERALKPLSFKKPHRPSGGNKNTKESSEAGRARACSGESAYSLVEEGEQVAHHHQRGPGDA